MEDDLFVIGLRIVAAMGEPDQSAAMEETHTAAFRATEVLRIHPSAVKHEPFADVVSDFLTDLRHLCKGLDVDVDELWERSGRHFESEDVDE